MFHSRTTRASVRIMEKLLARWVRAVDADPLNESLYSTDPAGRPTHWAPASVWRSAAARHRRDSRSATISRRGDRARQHGLTPPAGFSGWRTHLVGVVASHRGEFTPSPSMTAIASFLVYQRVDPTGPNYSPNIGFEGGAFVQFIATYYEHLPNQTMFLQEEPSKHNVEWARWVECLSSSASYAPLTAIRLRAPKPNGQTLDVHGAFDALSEQCWRDLLSAFGLSHLLPPRTSPQVNYWSGAMVL
jgi:hypothetical protein